MEQKKVFELVVERDSYRAASKAFATVDETVACLVARSAAQKGCE